jgi:hypothetical protein
MKNNSGNDRHGIENYNKHNQIEKSEFENLRNCHNKTDNYTVIPKKKKNKTKITQIMKLIIA